MPDQENYTILGYQVNAPGRGMILTTRCNRCGTVISGKELHDKFHDTLDKMIADFVLMVVNKQPGTVSFVNHPEEHDSFIAEVESYKRDPTKNGFIKECAKTEPHTAHEWWEIKATGSTLPSKWFWCRGRS